MNPSSVSNPNSSDFRLVICDGPNLPGGNPQGYVACDFTGLMLQVQHLINIFMILGVICAIVGFVWAGFLYISGKPGNIDQAHKIFQRVFVGFVMMLTAWFIVYQLLSWLVGNSAVKSFLSSP